ncbi:MAG: four helix bundle protein [Saprospiraceae bacterium]
MTEKTSLKNDPLREKTFQFAVRIVKLNQHLINKHKEFTLSKQILKSGTNPGAMAREAAFAESGSDFIHKLSIGRKENGETQYWLELLYATEYISEIEFKSLMSDSVEIGRLLTSSIKTKKKNLASI